MILAAFLSLDMGNIPGMSSRSTGFIWKGVAPRFYPIKLSSTATKLSQYTPVASLSNFTLPFKIL